MAQTVAEAQGEQLALRIAHLGQKPLGPRAALHAFKAVVRAAQQVGQARIALFAHGHIQRYRVALRAQVQQGQEFLRRNPHTLRQLRGGRRAQMLALEALLLLRHLVKALAHIARHAHHAAFVAQVVAHVAGDGGHRIGDKAKTTRRVKALQRLEQRHAGHLLQILRFHAAAGKLACHGPRQGQVTLKQLVPKGRVSAGGIPFQQRDQMLIVHGCLRS